MVNCTLFYHLNLLAFCKTSLTCDYNLLAILYARQGDEQEAVRRYLTACRQEPSYVHRGNLDPEISRLIKAYRLNGDAGEAVPPDL